MTKQHKGTIADDAQESLVQALESIKGLLEKSENKLSAARESIALANDSSKKSKFRREEEIPVLSDIVAIDNLIETFSVSEDPIPTVPQGIDCEDVIKLIDEFQERVKPLLNKAITSSSILKLEEVLNKTLDKELRQLRSKIKKLEP